ncbi:MAG TPA: hypothetical protein VF184_13370 [Phycisphaeraceae bacterium]
MAHEHTTRNRLFRRSIAVLNTMSWISLILIGVVASLSLVLLVLELFSQ